MLFASCSDLINASISSAAFLRFSFDRSPSSRCTTGGRGDSFEIECGYCEAEVTVDGTCEIDPATEPPCTLLLSERGAGTSIGSPSRSLPGMDAEERTSACSPITELRDE